MQVTRRSVPAEPEPLPWEREEQRGPASRVAGLGMDKRCALYAGMVAAGTLWVAGVR